MYVYTDKEKLKKSNVNNKCLVILKVRQFRMKTARRIKSAKMSTDRLINLVVFHGIEAFVEFNTQDIICLKKMFV